METISDNTDYDKLFSHCIGCSSHTQQFHVDTRCWRCSRYYDDLYAAEEVRLAKEKY